MKTVKVRVNTTIEYEVTLKVHDYINDDDILKIALTLEGSNLEDCNAKEIAVYNDMIDWYIVDEETA